MMYDCKNEDGRVPSRQRLINDINDINAKFVEAEFQTENKYIGIWSLVRIACFHRRKRDYEFP